MSLLKKMKSLRWEVDAVNIKTKLFLLQIIGLKWEPEEDIYL